MGKLELNEAALAQDLDNAKTAVLAKSFEATGSKRALVIGAETFSRIIDWSDRSTCVLFGDGAGAVVLWDRDEASLARVLARGCWSEVVRFGALRDPLLVGAGDGHAEAFDRAAVDLLRAASRPAECRAES